MDDAKVEIMESVYIHKIKERFEETINQLVIKGKINTLRDEVLAIANEALNHHNQVVAELKSTHQSEMKTVEKRAREQADSLRKLYAKFEAELKEEFQTLKKEVTDKANKQRKDAAARGNRFKKQYDDLLSAIDGVLPGAKHLIENRAIPEREKQRRLKKLDTQIKTQEAEVEKCLGETHPKYRTRNLLSGYGRERKILDTLRRRRENVKTKVTYDDTIETSEPEKGGEKNTN